MKISIVRYCNYAPDTESEGISPIDSGILLPVRLALTRLDHLAHESNRASNLSVNIRGRHRAKYEYDSGWRTACLIDVIMVIAMLGICMVRR